MKRADALRYNELMAACRESGKKGGWEPEAIEHWRWQLQNGEGKERVLAWVKLHSIARGSPMCVGETGRPLRVEACAADLGLALQTTRDHCTKLVAEGRIRLKKAQLWYRADVPEEMPVPAAPVADATVDENSWVHKNFVGYVADSYWKHPAEKRAEIRATWDAFGAWRQQAFLEGLAGLRQEIARVEVNTLLALGLPKIVLPKKAAQNPRWFQLSLLGEPSFVHEKGTAAVSGASNTAAGGGVQGGPSLLPSTPHHTVVKSPPPSPTETAATFSIASATLLGSPAAEVVVVASRIEGLNGKTAAQLLKNCRAVEPSLTALECVHLALAKLRASPSAHSPVGLLLKTLANDAAGPTLSRAREAARREEERDAADAAHAAKEAARSHTEAQAVLADPAASADDVEWAQGILAKAKGAGDGT
jgi:hypothetical protein